MSGKLWTTLVNGTAVKASGNPGRKGRQRQGRAKRDSAAESVLWSLDALSAEKKRKAPISQQRLATRSNSFSFPTRSRDSEREPERVVSLAEAEVVVVVAVVGGWPLGLVPTDDARRDCGAAERGGPKVDERINKGVKW